jgi:DNA replication protein DnaC
VNVIEKVFNQKAIIDQLDFNSIANTWIEKSEGDELLSEFYRMSLHGGKCSKCGSDFILIEVRLENANYDYFKPACDCYAKKENENHVVELEKIAVKNCGIPETYAKCSISAMSTDIKPETLQAIEQVKEYVKTNSWTIKGLIITGDIGVGKTHVAVAILKYLAANKGKSGIFVDCCDLRENAIRSKEDYVKQVIGNQVVLLDDFDKLSVQGGSWTMERVFSLINGLVNHNRLILMTCNYADKGDISKNFGEAISSRLHKSCLHIHMLGDNFRLRDDR